MRDMYVSQKVTDMCWSYIVMFIICRFLTLKVSDPLKLKKQKITLKSDFKVIDTKSFLLI